MSTDVRFTLRELQPPTQDRQQPYPDWYHFFHPFPTEHPRWENGAGSPYPTGVNATSQGSVMIIRDVNHQDNLSGGKETFIPERLLYGLLPSALFDVTYLIPPSLFCLLTHPHLELLVLARRESWTTRIWSSSWLSTLERLPNRD